MTVSKINFQSGNQWNNNHQAKLVKLRIKSTDCFPPMTVAAASGEGWEGKAMGMINQFVKDSGC